MKKNIIVVIAAVFILLACFFAVMESRESNENNYNANQNNTNNQLSNNTNDFNDISNPNASATRDDNQSIPIMSLSQVAIKNENFLDTMVSWHDSFYNYYVFNIGEIKNVPLTSTYAIIPYYGGTTNTFSQSITKSTEQSIERATSKAVTESVRTEKVEGFNINIGLADSIQALIGANVQAGYSSTTTNITSSETYWTSTYKEYSRVFNEEKNTVSFTFDSSSKHGNYLYLQLGHVNVYLAVIQPIDDLDTYYFETYNSVYASKYALVYTGEDDSFPINEEKKIDVNTSFVSSLTTPKKFIKGKIPDITLTEYWDDNITVSHITTENGELIEHGHMWKYSLGNLKDYLDKGYNKIEIKYNFYTIGEKTWDLFGGNVNLNCHISRSNSRNDAVYFESVPSSTKGKEIDLITVEDLVWFENGEIYLLIYNGNYSLNFSVSRLTMTIRLYEE